MSDGTTKGTREVELGEMRLEVVVLPLADVDRAKQFYVETLGFGLDADFPGPDGFRVVQVTPPGSPCSVIFGHDVTEGVPGAVQDTKTRVGGPDPHRNTDGSFASFHDPDGSGWLLQEITTPLPGR
jgi:catechol 2,3-dioxygenase-like lactoylglutathione lyase family enzyme